MNAHDIAHQVSTTLGDHADDYNIDAIVEEITDTHGHVDIDTIDSADYWAIVERHDTTGEQAENAPAHYTAWLTTDPSALDGDHIDITVLEDELIGDPNAWASTPSEQFHAVTAVHHDDDPATAQREAEDLLAAAGWDATGSWTATDTGHTITVSRA